MAGTPLSIVIVGAGPAGSLAAILLARAGLDVSLVEQHRFPRDKVCGECLSALGIAVLRRASLLHHLEPFQPSVLRGAILHSPAGGSLAIDLPEPMWGLSRGVFDAALLDAARAASAHVIQPARCEQIDCGAAPRVTIRCLRTNQPWLLQPDWVLLADGKAALMPSRPAGNADLGIKAHFLDVEAAPDAIELFGGTGCYGGLAPIEGHRWNAAFSVPQSRVRDAGGDIDQVFAHIVTENAPLRRRLRGASRITAWLAAPVPRFAVASEWPARVIPLGNAAAAVEPIGGEGMGLALRSAELCAEWLIETASTGSQPDYNFLRRAYRRLWRTRRPACRAAAIAFSAPRLTDLVLPSADGAQHLLEPLLRLAGKGR